MTGRNTKETSGLKQSHKKKSSESNHFISILYTER